MKNDQISVWAPSKIVLDTVDTPAPAPGESADLALWLGQMLQAVKVLVVGGLVPASDLAAASQSVPVEVVAVESVEI
jgi:dihydroneopterin aldolase